MARKSIGYTHLQWTCPSCNGKNRGTDEICGNCQAPQPDDIQFEQPAQENLIKDKKMIERAKAGADIHCGYCGTRNVATAVSCTQCGADLSEGQARKSGQHLGSHRKKAAPDINCEFCGTANKADAGSCTSCGASLAGKPVLKPRATPRTLPTPSKRRVSPSLIAILVAACIGLVVIAVLFNRTDDVVGRVEAVEWERTVAIEELGPASYEDWRGKIPSDGTVGVCTEKVHHTQTNPAPNSVEVCGEPYTVDTGTGVGEIVQDCEYQVYENWCEYTVNEWHQVDEVMVTGNNYSPQWPQTSLASNQREGEQDENYRVIFSTDGDRYNYGVSSLNALQQYEINSDWILHVNTFDIVVDVEPAD